MSVGQLGAGVTIRSRRGRRRLCTSVSDCFGVSAHAANGCTDHRKIFGLSLASATLYEPSS